VLLQDLALDPPEFRLAAGREQLRDRDFLCGLDLVIDVEEVPPETVRQVASHRRFAGCHEAHHVNPGRPFQLEDHDSAIRAMRACASPGSNR
jgi:hypothetical protein